MSVILNNEELTKKVGAISEVLNDLAGLLNDLAAEIFAGVRDKVVEILQGKIIDITFDGANQTLVVSHRNID